MNTGIVNHNHNILDPRFQAQTAMSNIDQSNYAYPSSVVHDVQPASSSTIVPAVSQNVSYCPYHSIVSVLFLYLFHAHNSLSFNIGTIQCYLSVLPTVVFVLLHASIVHMGPFNPLLFIRICLHPAVIASIIFVHVPKT